MFYFNGILKDEVVCVIVGLLMMLDNYIKVIEFLKECFG